MTKYPRQRDSAVLQSGDHEATEVEAASSHQDAANALDQEENDVSYLCPMQSVVKWRPEDDDRHLSDF